MPNEQPLRARFAVASYGKSFEFEAMGTHDNAAQMRQIGLPRRQFCRNFIVIANVWLFEFRVRRVINRLCVHPMRSVGLNLAVAFKPRLPIPKRIFRRVSDD